MANVRNSNTALIDSIGALPEIEKVNIKLKGVILTPDGGDARLVLEDKVTTKLKLDLKVLVGDSSQFFDFSSSPIVFPNGIVPVAPTANLKATLILEETGA